ncbi:MAG TPA: hypothetical protein VH143_19785 [Kofleriaceae bacterium]|jgi:hypothetical protein|nr:hypothetical protein [Kofleriaceae bacterium]
MTMKKIVIVLALASTALLATPVLACPNHDEAAPQTKTASDKTDAKKPATTATTKPAPAPAQTKPIDKPADKVSSR